MNKKILYALLCLFTLTVGMCLAQPTTSIVGAKNSSLCQMPDVVNYTAADYIQDGIVSMFDGIENSGWGVHEDNPQTWVDLVGEDSIGKYGAGQSPAYDTWFNDKALQGRTYFKNPKSITLYNAFTNSSRTLEMSFTRTSSGNTVGLSEFVSGNWMNIAGFIGTRLLLYHQGNALYINPPSIIPYTMTVSLSVDRDVCNVYVNGKYTASLNPGSMNIPGNSRLFLGMNMVLADNITYFAAWTHCIRVYSRALSADEVQSNYKIDRARFR